MPHYVPTSPSRPRTSAKYRVASSSGTIISGNTKSKFDGGFVYILYSEQATQRVRREFSESQIPNLNDKDCRVCKIGFTERIESERIGEILSVCYAGHTDWRIAVFRDQKCLHPCKHAQFMESKIHENFYKHRKVKHLNVRLVSWCRDKDGAASKEIFFGPLPLIAAYVRTLSLAEPADLKALGDARAEIERLEGERKNVNARISGQVQTIEMYRKRLGSAESAVACSKGALAASERKLDVMIAETNWWKNAALLGWTTLSGATLILLACRLLGWWP